MRVLVIGCLLGAGCFYGGEDDYVSPPPECTASTEINRGFGDEHRLGMLVLLPQSWPWARNPAVAQGAAFDLMLWRCDGGDPVAIDALADLRFEPPELAVVENTTYADGAVSVRMIATAAGEGAIHATVDSGGDAVSDHVPIRVREPAGVAVVQLEAVDPVVAGAGLSAAEMLPIADDGELLWSVAMPAWSTPDGLVNVSASSIPMGGWYPSGSIELAGAGTPFVGLMPALPYYGWPIEPAPFEVVSQDAVVSTVVSLLGDRCAASGGTIDGRVTLRDATGRVVHGGATLLTSSAPSVLPVQILGLDQFSAVCSSPGTAELSIALPNAPWSRTMTVEPPP